MARIKNLTDEQLALTALDLLVDPDAIVDVPDCRPFHDHPLWQVTKHDRHTAPAAADTEAEQTPASDEEK